MLFLGFKNYVYNTSIGWGSDDTELLWLTRYNSAAEIQKDLIKKGFFKCPECEWATETENEHIAQGDGYCYDRFGGPTLSEMSEMFRLGKETDTTLSVEKTPDHL